MARKSGTTVKKITVGHGTEGRTPPSSGSGVTKETVAPHAVKPAPASWDHDSPEVQTADHSAAPAFVATDEDIANLKQRLAAAQQSQHGQPLELDGAMARAYRTYGGRNFRIMKPTMFARRDMLQALAALQEYSGLESETDYNVKLIKTAEAQERQIAAILPSLHILDMATMQYRQATMDEAGYAIDDEALLEIMSIVLPQTNAAAEMERAGIKDVK